jgi:hypothetical protein
MVLLLVLPGLGGCDDVRGAVRAGQPDAVGVPGGATLALDLPVPYSPPGCGDAP